jgi:hypothetical protein
VTQCRIHKPCLNSRVCFVRQVLPEQRDYKVREDVGMTFGDTIDMDQEKVNAGYMVMTMLLLVVLLLCCCIGCQDEVEVVVVEEEEEEDGDEENDEKSAHC